MTLKYGTWADVFNGNTACELATAVEHLLPPLPAPAGACGGTTMPKERVLLATGYATWYACERITDRYGCLYLMKSARGRDGNVLLEAGLSRFEGVAGTLLAVVVSPVQSGHIGDIARGIRPSLPNIGEEVVLGRGALFIESRGRAGVPHEQGETERKAAETLNGMADAFRRAGATVMQSPDEAAAEACDLVGVRPDDGRGEDWLDPRSLYRIHSSGVNLFFIPD